MTRITVQSPFTHLVDPTTGRNLGLGNAYFGSIDSSPATNPTSRINVYAVQPDGSELLISQPITMSAAGLFIRNGSPVQLRVDGEYALQVMNFQGVQSYYAARVGSWEQSVDTRLDAIETAADKYYDTVAQMKAGNNPAGKRITCNKFQPTGPLVANLSYLSRGQGWPVTADQYVNHSDSNGNFLELISDELAPEQCGAVGNGIAIDQVPIQKCVDFAVANRKAVVFNAGFVYGLNGYILVNNGIKGLYGKGGTLKYIGPLFSGIMLQGIVDGKAANVSRCTISGLIVDCNNQPGSPVFMKNASECIVTNNQFYGVRNGYGVLSRCYIAGGGDAMRNQITNNIITLTEPTDASDPAGQLVYGIALDSEINYAPFPDAPSYWKANKADKAATFVNAYSNVANNVILGGYYGLQLDSARFCNVEGNQTTRNVRGVSVQHGCVANTISGNNVIDNTSGGIHIAYASNANIVEGNTIYSTRANQQALLNCYVGCFGNKFSNNQVTIAGTANPNWHIYVGVNCSQNEFSENTLRGAAQKAYIAVESAWLNTVTNQASYGFGEGPEVNNFASTSTADNVISNNKVYPTSAKPAIFLSQVTDGAGSYALTRTVVHGNIIMNNTPSRQLELFEMTTGAISFTRLKDNGFDTDADQARFVLPNGQASFREYTGNTYLNTGNFNLPANGSTPNAAIGNVIAHTDTVATNVTTYTGCNDNYDVTVRLSLNTTLVHSTGSMRLRGNANVVGSAVGGANAFIRLRQLGGVWFEQWRNF